MYISTPSGAPLRGLVRARPASLRRGGLDLFAARLPHAGSVAVAAWIGLGARRDPPGKSGLSHLVEHLLLQRTGPGGDDLVAEVESRGGEVQAYQYKDGIRVAVRMPAADVDFALEALARIVGDEPWHADEVVAERAAVVNELGELADWLEDYATRTAMDGLWPATDWGRSVCGVAAEAAGLGPEDVAATWAAARRSPLVAGVVGPAAPAFYLRRARGALGPLAPQAPPVVPGPPEPTPPPRPAQPVPPVVLRVCRRAATQAHLSLALAAPSRSSPAFPALEVADALLAGGSGGSLLDALRGRRPLTYGVVSDIDIGVDLNSWLFTFATPGVQAAAAVAAVLGELDRVRRGEIAAPELERARRYRVGRLALELDNPTLCARWLLLEMAAAGRPVSPLEHGRRWLGVIASDVAAVVAAAAARGVCLAVVGDVPAAQIDECRRALGTFSGAACQVIELA